MNCRRRKPPDSMETQPQPSGRQNVSPVRIGSKNMNNSVARWAWGLNFIKPGTHVLGRCSTARWAQDQYR